MKWFRFIFCAFLSIVLGFCLNTKIQQIPPIGKFFSPFHGFWSNIENDTLPLSSSISVEHTKNMIDVYFDNLMIPHIKASNIEDMFYAQGYITAYHRLWQMEFQMLVAQGRLSEIVGIRALDIDRLHRRIGLEYGAKKSLEKCKQEDTTLYKKIVAYTNGVNEFIESLHQKDLPIEYKLLDYQPEPWTPFKCFLLFKYMSNMLSRGERDLEHTNALKLWGRKVFDILYPEIPDFVDPVIPTGTPFNFKNVKTPLDYSSPFISYTYPTISPPNEFNGSNSVAVNKKMTKGGTTLLSNELDLSLNLPSIWYVVHLMGPNFNTMGASLPGALGVVVGFNKNIAWGNTNAKRDVVDWYNIEFNNTKREFYRYNNQWVSPKSTIEKFKVRNESFGSEVFYDTLLYTHHGPVVYDRNFGSEKYNDYSLAMKWTAHDGSTEQKTLLNVNQAKDFDTFHQAFKDFTGPAQNYTFASVSGDIAMHVNGKFPVKHKEQGKFLLDGNNIFHEWSGYIPFEHNPGVKNPSTNFVSSANQHPADSTYPYYAYDYNYEHFRGRRINSKLQLMSNIEVEDMMGLQYDNFNYHASESLPLMLSLIDAARLKDNEKEIYTSLEKWNYFNNATEKAPTIFNAWWDELNDLLWDEIDSSSYPTYRPHKYNTFFILKNHPKFSMIDNQITPKKESVKDLVRVSFKNMQEKLSSPILAWYQHKNTTVKHLLGLPVFSFDSLKIGGGRSIINAASELHGPSWRMVVSLGEEGVAAWGVYPGSQTGNPANPLYGHMVKDWANRKYHALLFESFSPSHPKIKYHIKLKSQL